MHSWLDCWLNGAAVRNEHTNANVAPDYESNLGIWGMHFCFQSTQYGLYGKCLTIEGKIPKLWDTSVHGCMDDGEISMVSLFNHTVLRV